LTGDLASECQQALPGAEALLYAVGASIVAWVIVSGGPWAVRAFREIKKGKRVIKWDPQMVIPGLLVVGYVVAPAWVATVIGDPSTTRDAVILGLGAQGFVLAFVGK